MAAGALGLLILAGLMHPLGAQTVTTSYGSDTPLQKGMIVGLKKDEPEKVIPLNYDSPEHLHGVIIDGTTAPLTLTQEGQQVFVATVGRHEVLVSTQNGPIASGDLISTSVLSGIGTIADEKQPEIFGKALAPFDGKNGAISTTVLTEAGGATREVGIGRIPVDVSITKNPLVKPKEPDLPEFLKKIAENIAHKPVAMIRIYSSLAVLIATVIVSTSLIYGGVRSSVYSLGRNPLSRKTIIRGMVQVVLFGIIVFASGIFGVYLLLRL